MKTKVLIYCTKGTPKTQLVDNRDINNKFELCWCLKPDRNQLKNHIVNGKIVAECEVECEHFEYERIRDIGGYWFDNGEILDKKFYKKSCLTYEQLNDYLGTKVGYALHISNLKIFDKPKELSEFKTRHYPQFAGMVRNKTHHELKPLTNAPQNMCWCYYKDERYCLISIRPEWVCKILNGEKTIEVRKKVLKEMI